MLLDEFSPEDIFAGNVMPVVTESAIAASNQNIPKLSIVEKNDEGNIVVPSGETIDTLKAYGVASEEVVTSESETKPIILYMTGEFRGKNIVVPEGKTIEDYRVPLRKLGIFIK